MTNPLEPQPRPTPPVPARGTGVSLGLVAGLLLGVAVGVLAAQNTARASLHFLWWHTRSPLVVIILATAVAGVALDEAVGFLWRHRRGGRRRRLSQR